jgi:ribosome-associated toxin RatA of RatAB toxin-antitoxin module
MADFRPLISILLFVSILASSLFVPTTTSAAATKEKKNSPPWHEVEREMDVSAEHVFDTLSNCENYSDLFLFLDKSRLLYKKRGGPKRGVKIHICYFETESPMGTFWSKFQVSAVKTGRNTYKILGKALEKNFGAINLKWKITKIAENRAKLHGRFRLKLELPPLPDKMIQRYAKRSFKRVFYLFILRKF